MELIKLGKYTSFKVLLGMHLSLFLLVVFVSSQINITVPGFDTGNLFRFPHVWSYFAWIASWFNLLLAIIIVMVTGNEFSYRTFRQHVIDGLPRGDLLKGKLTVVFTIAVYSFLLVFLTGMVYGLIYSPSAGVLNILAGKEILFIYFLQTVAYMVIGLLLAIIFRSTALSIILFILFRFPVEPIIRSFFPHQARPFFPMKSIGSLTPMPEFLTISSETRFEAQDGSNALSLSGIGILPQGLPVSLQILIVLAYILLFTGLALFILKKRDL